MSRTITRYRNKGKIAVYLSPSLCASIYQSLFSIYKVFTEREQLLWQPSYKVRLLSISLFLSVPLSINLSLVSIRSLP